MAVNWWEIDQEKPVEQPFSQPPIGQRGETQMGRQLTPEEIKQSQDQEFWRQKREEQAARGEAPPTGQAGGRQGTQFSGTCWGTAGGRGSSGFGTNADWNLGKAFGEAALPPFMSRPNFTSGMKEIGNYTGSAFDEFSNWAQGKQNPYRTPFVGVPEVDADRAANKARNFAEQSNTERATNTWGDPYGSGNPPMPKAPNPIQRAFQMAQTAYQPFAERTKAADVMKNYWGIAQEAIAKGANLDNPVLKNDIWFTAQKRVGIDPDVETAAKNGLLHTNAAGKPFYMDVDNNTPVYFGESSGDVQDWYIGKRDTNGVPVPVPPPPKVSPGFDTKEPYIRPGPWWRGDFMGSNDWLANPYVEGTPDWKLRQIEVDRRKRMERGPVDQGAWGTGGGTTVYNTATGRWEYVPYLTNRGNTPVT